MNKFIVIVILVLSIYITYKICGVWFANSFGTTGAYAKRAIFLWFIVMAILCTIAGKLGLIPLA